VARAARVSISTASRYVRGVGYVSPATGARIEMAVRQVDYRPNAIARSLRHQRTHTLALVVPEIENPFYTTVSRGVEDVANAEGYAVIFCNTDEQEVKQGRYLQALLERQIDGLLFVPCGDSTAHCRMLDDANVPYVFIDREIPGTRDAVLGDNVDGGRQLTHHLVSLGHRRIGLVGGNPDDSVSRERRAGYELALAQAGFTYDHALVREGDWSIESGHHLVLDLLGIVDPPTALVCGNNLVAVGAILALNHAGRRIPEDVAVVCFDDIELASLIEPFLTVAVQPAYEMGRRATALLLDRIARRRDDTVVRDVLPTHLIIRRSCGAPAPDGQWDPPPSTWIGRRYKADGHDALVIAGTNL